MCAFIEKYISCAIPKEDGPLKELVLLLQKHKHSSYCKRNKCRFNFPHPPSSKTLIDPDPSVVSSAQSAFSKVRKVLLDGHTDLSLDDLLVKAGVKQSEYDTALQTSSRGNVVVLKRQPSGCCVNNYNSCYHDRPTWTCGLF